MYLIEPSVFDIAKKQYLFKLKTNFGLFFSLIIVQMFAILLTLSGMSGSTSTGGSGFDITISFISGNIVIVLTLIWALSISITMTSIKDINMDFTFVSNRLTSSCSNIGLLITLSFYAGIATALSSNLIRILYYYIYHSKNIVNEGFFISPKYILMNIISTVLYIILIISIGYFLGSLFQHNKVFIILFFAIPFGIIFGLKLFSSNLNGTSIYFLTNIFNFYFKEGSLIIFAIKVLITVAVLFSIAVLLSKRLEVRK
ncbi:MAG TPA: hypothetical protein VIK72_04860 [Clostridiaceae bacterium]